MDEEIKRWWEQSLSDLKNADKNITIEAYDVSCFLSQQAVEKALKALYIKKLNLLPTVHDLVFLATKLKLSENLIEKCDALTKVYTDTRYPDVAGDIPHKKFNRQSAITFLRLAKEIIEWIKAQI